MHQISWIDSSCHYAKYFYSILMRCVRVLLFQFVVCRLLFIDLFSFIFFVCEKRWREYCAHIQQNCICVCVCINDENVICLPIGNCYWKFWRNIETYHFMHLNPLSLYVCHQNIGNIIWSGRRVVNTHIHVIVWLFISDILLMFIGMRSLTTT